MFAPPLKKNPKAIQIYDYLFFSLMLIWFISKALKKTMIRIKI